MEEWIDKKVRPPTEEDADGEGLVLAWHRYQGTMVTGWRQIADSRMYTHWQKMPEPPVGYKKLRE